MNVAQFRHGDVELHMLPDGKVRWLTELRHISKPGMWLQGVARDSFYRNTKFRSFHLNASI